MGAQTTHRTKLTPARAELLGVLAEARGPVALIGADLRTVILLQRWGFAEAVKIDIGGGVVGTRYAITKAGRRAAASLGEP